jgi:RHS repeat-associated protein
MTSSNIMARKKQEEFGLNWNDYGARFYDPQLGRWHAFDPLAEKYMDNNPYNFVSNNPMLYVDDDGKDYSIYFERNKEGNWHIRISATYYVKKGDKESKESADAAVSAWNNIKDYSLMVKNENGQKSQISVLFDLKVLEVNDPEDEKSKDLSSDENALTKDGSSNVYNVVNESEIKGAYAEGETEALYRIKVPKGAGLKTGMHEIGHTLGLDDKSSGVMAGGSDTGINNWDVEDIINFATKMQEKFPNNRKVSITGDIPKGKVKTTDTTIKKYEKK